MHVTTFIVLSTLLTLTPGPDFALVTRNSLAHGRRGAVETTLGIGGGVVLWVAACAAGITALVRDAPGVFLGFKLAGAVYLGYLGLSSLWHSRGVDGSLHVAGAASARKSLWVQGFVSTSLNPKLGMFLVAFFPAFIDKTKPVVAQTAFLGAIHLVIDVTWFFTYGLLVAGVGAALIPGAARHWLQRASGMALLLFAVLLITTSAH
jgi:threonine/homoserine/homoserine lactone efflux protein